jgi:hypothetical protein
MLNKTTNGVLASFRGLNVLNHAKHPASSLAAALLDGLYEHPELLWHQKHSAEFQRFFYI